MEVHAAVLQFIVDGILYGIMYGLAAIGLNLIFGTMRIVFIAQGTLIVFLAYLCFWLFSLYGVDPYLSLVPIMILGFLLGMGFYHGIFKEAALLKDRIGSLLLAVGIMFFMENFMMIAWTPNPRAVVTSYGFYAIEIFGVKLTLTRVMALALGLLSVLALALFLKKTFLGMAVRAASEDMEASTLVGINPHKVNAVSFAIGLAVAAVAGVNIAVTYSFDPMYGLDVAIKALIALTLGGIGSFYGGFIGGILLGLIESSGAYLVGTGWAQGICFAVFLLTLILKPQGLFGERTS